MSEQGCTVFPCAPEKSHPVWCRHCILWLGKLAELVHQHSLVEVVVDWRLLLNAPDVPVSLLVVRSTIPPHENFVADSAVPLSALDHRPQLREKGRMLVLLLLLLWRW